jgi:pyridoxamine 5'-phosphate oxidase
MELVPRTDPDSSISSQPMNDRQKTPNYGDLDAAVETAWRLLAEGVKTSRSECHILNLATVTDDGLPSIRSVVIRGFDARTRSIRFHTDYRSKKLSEITQRPYVVAHLYALREKVQLRMLCRATVDHGNSKTSAAWRSMKAMSRRCYGQLQAPGTAIEAPELIAMEPLAFVDATHENFAVVTAKIQTLDWLYLDAAGHRRAFFDWRNGAEIRTWLAP